MGPGIGPLIAMNQKYKLHLMKYGEIFYGQYMALTPAVVKINRFLKKLPLRAMNALA